MNKEDRTRMIRSLEEAVAWLEQEAHCYCYLDEPEFREIIELLRKKINRLRGEQKERP